MARAGLTSERVTSAAADLADELGFENVTVAALARGFGVKDASLYSHVKNVRDLRERVSLQAAGEFAERLSSAVAGRRGRDALIAFADAYRAFALEHAGRYAAIEYELAPEVLATSHGHRRMVETTSAMLRGYDLPQPDATDAVRLLRSYFHGFVSIEAVDGFHHERDPEESWRRNLEVLHSILTNWPAEPAEA
jgi:AcrR family transcriptional regulator